MTAFGIEVLVKLPQGASVWQRVRPRGGEPYTYATREEAESMARLCYDADPSSARVVEVKEAPNSGKGVQP